MLLLRSSGGVDIDVSLGAIPFEVETSERATPFEFESGLRLITCSAEDLIIHKAVAGRPRDVADIETIVLRQTESLDAQRIRHWLHIFAELKEDPDVLGVFESALRRAVGA